MPLPAPPMVDLELDAAGSAEDLSQRLLALVAPLDPRSVVRLRLRGSPAAAALPILRASSLRTLAPPGMHVSIAWPRPPAGAAQVDEGSRSKSRVAGETR